MKTHTNNNTNGGGTTAADDDAAVVVAATKNGNSSSSSHHHHHRSSQQVQEESQSLQYLLSSSGEVEDDDVVDEFFNDVWQNSCALFSVNNKKQKHDRTMATEEATATATAETEAAAAAAAAIEKKDDGSNTNMEVEESSDGDNNNNNNNNNNETGNPLQDLLDRGWETLIDLMQQQTQRQTRRQQITQPSTSARPAERRRTTEDERPTYYEHEPPILFRNCQIIDEEERMSKYQESLWSAFLDGCSIVINHADFVHVRLAALCNDLQKSFPHAYANVYITPSNNTQTVQAHADDRDVFVIQIFGKKSWTVYENIPIPYPYPHEQVGKSSENPVPSHVLNGPKLIDDRILEPGDILYMPRGYVHEARTTTCGTCSFHVTIAFATHDWTMAGILQNASSQIYSKHIPFRMALPRQLGRRQQQLPPGNDDNGNNGNDEMTNVRQDLQQQIDEAVDMFRKQVTVDNIEHALYQKYQHHNSRANTIRSSLLSLAAEQRDGLTNNDDVVVGVQAAATVTWTTRLRAATDEERASVQTQQQGQQQQRGLHVREEIYDGILSIIQKIKLSPSGCTLQSLEQERPSGICNLTLMSMARRCVELGALAIEK